MVGEKHCTKVVLEERIAIVQTLLMQMRKRREIFQFIADNDNKYRELDAKGVTNHGMTLFDCTERQIDNYIKTATARMMKLREQELPSLQRKLYAVKLQLLGDAIKDGDKSLALKIVNSIEDREMGKPLQTVDSNVVVTDAEAIKDAVKDLDPDVAAIVAANLKEQY